MDYNSFINLISLLSLIPEPSKSFSAVRLDKRILRITNIKSQGSFWWGNRTIIYSLNCLDIWMTVEYKWRILSRSFQKTLKYIIRYSQSFSELFEREGTFFQNKIITFFKTQWVIYLIVKKKFTNEKVCCCIDLDNSIFIINIKQQRLNLRVMIEPQSYLILKSPKIQN